MKKSYVIILFCLLVCSFFAGSYTSKKISADILYKKDTVYITKTVKEYLSKPDKIDFKHWDYSIPEQYFFTDTVRTKPVFIHDTLYIPINTYYYERLNGRLRIWASGYNVSLDKWELDEQHTIISKQKRLEFRIGIGPGIFYSPFTQRIDAGMGIFYGLTYKF